MISRVIACFPGGHKKVFDHPKRILGLKHNGTRPHLLQVFGDHFCDGDKREIHQYKFVIHPCHGRMTLNGEFVTPEMMKGLCE